MSHSSTAILALALSVSAFPLYLHFDHSSSIDDSTSSLIPRSLTAEACNPGALICRGEGQVAVCPQFGLLVYQNTAPGTVCVDGIIQQSVGAANTDGIQATTASSSSSDTITITSTQFVTLAVGSTTAPPSSTSASSTASFLASSPTTAPSESLPTPASARSPPTPVSSSPSYQFFSGSGEPSAGWPLMSSWLSLESLFEANSETLSQSCSAFGVADNSPEEINHIKSAIQDIAQSSGVDARFIFAVMMQESNGCVRVGTTISPGASVTNPGLFQSHDGIGSCNTNDQVQDPCPASEITQMVTDGVKGTAQGPGLQQLLAQTGVSDVSRYYKAARMYNSGSIASSGNLDDGIATHCYSSDVANRFLGWTAGTNLCQQKLGTS